MNIPAWLIAAALGAVGGGLGGLIGWALERAGLKWGRYAAIAGIVAGISLSRSDGLIQRIQGYFITDESIEQSLMASEPADMFAYLKEAFPDDYRAFLRDAHAAIDGRGTGDSVERESAELMQSLRHKYARFVGLAPDAELNALLAAQFDFFQILSNEDPATCARVAVQGPMSLVGTEFGKRYAGELMAPTIALFRAARGGIDAPVTRPDATDELWASVGEGMAKAGAPQSYFEAIASIDQSNLETCPALLALLRAMIDGGEELSSVRASYLAEVAAS